MDMLVALFKHDTAATVPHELYCQWMSIVANEHKLILIDPTNICEFSCVVGEWTFSIRTSHEVRYSIVVVDLSCRPLYKKPDDVKSMLVRNPNSDFPDFCISYSDPEKC